MPSIFQAGRNPLEIQEYLVQEKRWSVLIDAQIRDSSSAAHLTVAQRHQRQQQQCSPATTAKQQHLSNISANNSSETQRQQHSDSR